MPDAGNALAVATASCTCTPPGVPDIHCSLFAAGSRESVLTYFTLLPIAGGVVIASGGEPLFNLLGFMACIIATCCRALKSVVQVRRSVSAD